MSGMVSSGYQYGKEDLTTLNRAHATYAEFHELQDALESEMLPTLEKAIQKVTEVYKDPLFSMTLTMDAETHSIGRRPGRPQSLARALDPFPDLRSRFRLQWFLCLPERLGGHPGNLRLRLLDRGAKRGVEARPPIVGPQFILETALR